MISNQRIRSLLEGGLSLTFEQQRKVKLSLLFFDWISPLPTLDLERKYNLRSGSISQAAQKMSWLLDSGSGLARVLNRDQKVIRFLKELSLMVQFGINRDGIKLAQLKIPGLGRDFIWRLIKADLCSFEKIKRAKSKDLQKMVPERQAKKLKEFLGRKPKTQRRREKAKGYLEFTKRTFPRLLLDGTPIKDRFLVFLDGQRVSLAAKSFGYLFKLAWAVLEKEEGWIHRLDLEAGDNQPKYIYRLKKELGRLAGGGRELIQNNRLGFYRLSIPKGKIEFNLRNLSLHPDAEIKRIVDTSSQIARRPV